MASSDLSVLLDMGFDKERADLAVKQSGGRKSTNSFLLQLYVLTFYHSSRCSAMARRQSGQIS
jgi:hypothetical protein